jgi:DNA-binding response OmpR family regulator
MSSTHTVLVVEDEVDIANAIVDRLRTAGYTVEAVHDGEAGVQRCRQWQPDLVILDLMLPGVSGHEVCRQIQQDRRVPVLMLSALDEEADVLVGLRMGADDYLTKPFSPRELVARVEAVLRRVSHPGDAPEKLVQNHGPVSLDEATRRVERDGEEVHLTPTEFTLLAALLRASGAVLTRSELLSEVWRYDDSSGSRTVDSHIRGLRRKLGDDVVRTVHGVGYAIGELV